MAQRLVRLALLVGVAFVFATPLAFAQEAGDLVGQLPTNANPTSSVDPNQAQQQVQQKLDENGLRVPAGDDPSGGSGTVPKGPLGGGNGFEGGVVWDILTVNTAATITISVGIAGLGVAAYFLASRYIDPKVALQSPERSMLYGFIKGNPGVHLKQLSTEFTMKTSTVLWHVRKLEHADLIRSKKANGYRVFYPVSGGLEASMVSEALTALSNLNARQVFAFLAENPEAQLRDLSERLRINAGTVRWHLKKLRKAGLLEEIGAMLRVTDLGVKAWNQLQGNPQVAQVPVLPIPAEIEFEGESEITVQQP